MSRPPAPDQPGSETRQAFVRATVVQAQRPTSARPGDSALVHADGRLEGFVGGQCAEATVRAHALRVMASGQPLLLRIVPGDGELPPDLNGTATVRNRCLSGGALQIFLEPQLPPPRMTVFGGSPTAEAVAELARQLGYEVRLAADEEVELLPDSEAVVVSSQGQFDEAALQRALSAGVGYVGLVASPRRGRAILEALDAQDQSRVHTPAGLDIGARSPQEIAISILAEIISLRKEAQDKEETQPAPLVAKAPLAVDPICGMTVVAAPPTLSLEEPGGNVWFCAESCRQAYQEAVHLGQGGGDERHPS